MHENPKLFVLGLDGGTLDLILPWVEQGFLPTFNKLINTSSYGELESTIPPFSPQAWTAFMTGVNPGKHGIFDFVSYETDTYKQVFNNTLNIRYKKIWDLIGECGKRSIVMNIPLTFPPQKISGIMISGMLTPPEAQFANPKEIGEELKRVIGSYVVDIDLVRFKDRDLILDDIYNATQLRFKAMHYLIDRYEWDLSIMVISETDRLQHKFWGEMEKTILPYYRRLDDLIGQLLNRLGEDTSFIILSDHGFGDLKKTVHLNSWLEKLGLLRKVERKNGNEDLLGVFFSKKTSLRDNSIYRRFFKDKQSLYNRIRRKLFPKDFDIDWPKTKAFVPYTGQIHGISLNMMGRQPDGVVDPNDYESLRDTIRRELLGLRDEQNGKKIVRKVFKREEIYSGPFIEESPDLLFTLEDYRYFVSSRIRRGVFGKEKRGLGTHRPNGLLFIRGKGVSNGKEILGSRIIDVAPTILYLLGLPIPKGFDGRVLTEALEPDVLKAYPIKKEDISLEVEGTEFKMTKTEEEEVRKSLRGLGYVE
jgi:predicted AlkP superfamily phosphohydrolase/phosphomutase